jgi:thiamine-phosphate pyrophosphorylase
VREGVRVLEDYVRFAKDDSRLTSQLKAWRHHLRSALAPVEERGLLISRDSSHDVGTSLTTPGERYRQSLCDVVAANCKRVQEGLRTLEEYGKIVSPLVGDEISKLRYWFYDFEKRLVIESRSQERLTGRHLYLLATREQCYLEFEIALRIVLNAGANIVQLREKNLSDREIVELGKNVREWTRETGALFIMNDRPDLAVLTDADGVHVGQEELTVRHARRIVGPNRLIGVSTHNIEQARKAVEDGADYLGVGPVFSSQTKAFPELAGLEFVRQVAEEIRLPWYAIGGINPENLPELLSAGATRIAISHAVCSSASPGEVLGKLKECMPARATK